jgi:hypothetical protein
MFSALARMLRCQNCSDTTYLALCSDGIRRAFDLRSLPAGAPGVWAWHRGQGMRETDVAPGYRLHFCAGGDLPASAPPLGEPAPR